MGDQVLIALAKRLQTACATLEHIDPLICRLGGDEFVVLLRRVECKDDAVEIADQIKNALESSFELANHRLVVSASVGLLIGDHHYQEPASLLRDADTAMYRAKISGKGRYEIFDAKMHKEVVNRMQLEQELRTAIENREFMVVYQPIIEIESGRLKAFEALVRWRHPAHGIVSPAVFIDLAEETGLITQIGGQVIDEVCDTIADWKANNLNVDHLQVSVNVSKRQIIEETLIERFLGSCQRTGIDASRLIIEVTESSVMADPDRVNDVLKNLRNTGFSIYMDDFGTGMSSLSSLHHMPVDAVKIDQSIVRHISVYRDNAAVVLSIVMLAHNLGLKVVAEGIEGTGQLAQLQAYDCDYGQGYLFSRPITKDRVLDWIRSNNIQWEQLRCA